MLLFPERKIIESGAPKYGKGEERDFETFVNHCKKFTDNLNLELLKKAYDFNLEANRNLFRKSGEPFYLHPLEVATFLVEYVMFDNDMVISSLLHDVLGKGGLITINDIEQEFGTVISQIVDNVYRITMLERKAIGDIEYFRRLVLSLTTDVRIIFIKIADRFHDMKTIIYLSPDLQKKYAEDTVQVYVPLAHRFGFYLIKSELEDMCFRVLDRENYDKIVRKLIMTKKERDEYLKSFAEPIIEKVKSLKEIMSKNINFEVHGRVKHVFSIYNKTLLRGKPVEELYDLIGLRIILDTEEDSLCENVIEEIKKIYKYIPETYKDYIKNPKPNGYQSIHCAFVGKDGHKVEVQVRTRKMHLVAEKGVAAHYRYKTGLISMDSIFDDPQIEKWVQDIRDILARKEEVPVDKILESFKYDIFSNEIYVLTPKQEIKILPKGSIALDFAYNIHTELGNRCAGAKINGRTSSIFTPLKNGDIVEIIQGQNLEPEYSWFDKVVTSKAKNAIQKYFTQSRGEYLRKGRDFFDTILSELDLNAKRSKLLNQCLKILKYPNAKDFYIELAKVEELRNILRLLIAFLKKMNFKFDNGKIKQDKELKKILEFSEKRILLGEETFEIFFSECCLPVPGDEAIAFVQGKKIFIHRVECRYSEFEVVLPETLKIPFDWKSIEKNFFEFAMRIKSPIQDQVFLLLNHVFQAKKDVQINYFLKELNEFNSFSCKLFLTVKDNSIAKTITDFIETRNLDIHFERIGKR